jgi:hypothetical protein
MAEVMFSSNLRASSAPPAAAVLPALIRTSSNSALRGKAFIYFL